MVVIYDISGQSGTKPIALPYENGFIEGLSWAKNDRLLIILKISQKMEDSGTVRTFYRTASVDSTGHNAVVLFKDSTWVYENLNGAAIADIDLDDPNHVFIPLFAPSVSDEYYDTMYSVDVTTGKAQRFAYGNADTNDWIMDGHGHVVARIDRKKHPLEDYLKIFVNGEWKEAGVFDVTGGRGTGIVGLSADGTAIDRIVKVDATGTKGMTQIAITDLEETPVFADPHYDISDALTDPWTGRVIGVSFVADQMQVRFFDPKMEALQKGLEVAFPGMEVFPVSWTTAQDKVIVVVSGPRQPPGYYLLDRTTHVATKISQTYRELSNAEIAEIISYTYKARDGLDIPAYLTLPPGKPAKNLPTVIMPHGGPMSRDQLGFDWMAQFLASRGYAVLQPNFRGSSGYGVKFEEAGYGEWGLKMQDDISDGVKKLVADGIADPKRICIVGASYGGYASLAGAAFTPDLYACAVSWAGVTDLDKFLKTRAEDYGNDSAMISSWTRYIGSRFNDSDKLKAVSPALHADRIICPILLMHGTDDTTVRIDQSEEMNDALLHAGKSVKFVRVDHETHYMETADTRVRVLKELEMFLAANIGN